MTIFDGEFHLLRPEWLLMIVPVIILSWLFWSRKLFSRDWESVIDARLLPHLLVGKTASRNIFPILFWTALAILSVIALSGPVWKKLPLPVFKQQSALVIILDLSTSMNAQDVKPSRLVRARLKLIDLLKQRKEGQTALIAYAGTAYTVSPLTDDTDTIQSLVSSLTPQIMPSQGSRVDLAVSLAVELFKNANLQKGDILLMTDDVTDKSLDKLESLNMDKFRLSVLSIGTEQGAPIPSQGGFVKDAEGSIVIAKTNLSKLHSLASQYGGLYHQLTLDDKDLNSMKKLFDEEKPAMDQQQTDFKADRWHEEGPWILLLVVPLAAMVFRRGVFLTLLIAFFMIPVPQPVYALDIPDSLSSWDNIWQNSNQRAQKKLNQGDAEKAAELFEDTDWKAASYYKAGQYEQALEQLENTKTADGYYNRGNALAKLGRLQEAMESYDESLKLQPDNEDAQFNRKQVGKALKKQQQKQKQDGDQNNQDQQNSDQQNQDQQNQDQQNSQQSDKQNSEQQSQRESDQQKEQDQQDLNQQQQAEQDEKNKAKEDQLAKQQEAEKQQDDKPQDENSLQQIDQQKTEDLSDQAEAQWLRKIPDDPGGLLRNKFNYQYGRQQQPTQEKEPW